MPRTELIEFTPRMDCCLAKAARGSGDVTASNKKRLFNVEIQ